MKATSKLISVVLILALCLSIFTISASADVVIGTSEEVTYSGSGDDGGEGLGLPAGTNDKNDAPAGTAATVEVATAADLDKELKDGANSIKLMDSFTYEGPLTLGAVTIDFNNKTLTISGDGAAAVIASGAVFKGGQLAVTGAVTDDQGNKTGFDSVASGLVTFRNVNMNLAGETILGSVSVVSGSFNKDVSANIASGSEKVEPAAAEGEQTVDTIPRYMASLDSKGAVCVFKFDRITNQSVVDCPHKDIPVCDRLAGRNYGVSYVSDRIK